jgi:hypothetical protein
VSRRCAPVPNRMSPTWLPTISCLPPLFKRGRP